MDVNEVAQLLSRAEACERLSETERRTLAERGRIDVAWKDAELVKEGTDGDSMIVMLDGEAVVEKRSEAGETRELATVGAGAVIGEMALLDTVPRSATVRATSPVRYFEMSRESFDALIDSGDTAAGKLGVGLARSLSRRKRKMIDRVMALLSEGDIAAENVRVAKFIEDMVVEMDG